MRRTACIIKSFTFYTEKFNSLLHYILPDIKVFSIVTKTTQSKIIPMKQVINTKNSCTIVKHLYSEDVPRTKIYCKIIARSI